MDKFDAAAKWWRDLLMEGAKQDNGDKSIHGLVGRGFMGILADRIPRLTEQEADAFQSSLTAALRASGASRWGIHNDYGADPFLRDAYKAATGREGDCPPFPIKTNMWFDTDGAVKVRYGYGAEIETIWPVPLGASPAGERGGGK